VGIRLLTRNGHDWAPRYPLIVEAVDRLKVRSCLIDGEAVACDKNGLAVFQRLRRKPGKHCLPLAFDLIDLKRPAAWLVRRGHRQETSSLVCGNHRTTGWIGAKVLIE